MEIFNRDQDRRTHVRIKDRILLEFRVVEQKEFQKIIESYQDGTDSPWTEYSHPYLAQGMQGYLNEIRIRDQALANAIEILDQKLSAVLGLLDQTKDGMRASKPEVVDMSAAGLCFCTSEAVSAGQILEMDIGLLPQHFFLHCFGKVTRSIKTEKGISNIAVKFTWITEDDQERLIEHIFRYQTLQLRLRRKQKEEENE